MGLLVLIATCSFCYLLYRILPLTILAIVCMVGVIGWNYFGQVSETGDAVTLTGLVIIVIAFIADVGMRVFGLFRKR
jgi:hypothetical protein